MCIGTHSALHCFCLLSAQMLCFGHSGYVYNNILMTQSSLELEDCTFMTVCHAGSVSHFAVPLAAGSKLLCLWLV